MDAFYYRPLDQVQPVSEISNMKQMQWWRDGVVVNPCKSNLGLSATSSTAFASFIWKARHLEKHRLSRFKGECGYMYRNLVRSKNDGGHCIHENGPKDGTLPIFVKALGRDLHSWFRFNLLQIDVIRTLQTTVTIYEHIRTTLPRSRFHVWCQYLLPLIFCIFLQPLQWST